MFLSERRRKVRRMEIRRLAPQTLQHLRFPTTWQVQNTVSL